MNREEADELLQRTAAQLHEHFEHVQILVSYNEASECLCLKHGCGNWYARVGMARELLVFDEAHIHANEIAQALKPPEDDERTFN